MFKYTTILTIVNNSDIVPSIDGKKGGKRNKITVTQNGGCTTIR